MEAQGLAGCQNSIRSHVPCHVEVLRLLQGEEYRTGPCSTTSTTVNIGGFVGHKWRGADEQMSSLSWRRTIWKWKGRAHILVHGGVLLRVALRAQKRMLCNLCHRELDVASYLATRAAQQAARAAQELSSGVASGKRYGKPAGLGLPILRIVPVLIMSF